MLNRSTAHARDCAVGGGYVRGSGRVLFREGRAEGGQVVVPPEDRAEGRCWWNLRAYGDVPRRAVTADIP